MERGKRGFLRTTPLPRERERERWGATLVII